ncbi:GntR family transcriptional regulator [Variovorax sp. Sphag1AA]|uniref:GntR family transcriptional regulator n=1 Tax=Variovorax sp. Sphag1AA TaxID=2587027 RepID=UPI001610D42D|nr:GntR family transcriptional regulator [Variovorax sp. Sphag1AA]MBB3182019.1 DNA-binding GntR family transcriptional regulator [Variovorax sp. Sphag1AA]
MNNVKQTPLRAADTVYGTLKLRILRNQLSGGSQLLEDTVAAELGVSRTPVREALARLEAEGLVEPIPRHGYRVLPITMDDIREIYEVLSPLETVAAELLAQKKPNSTEVKALQEAVDKMATALKADNLDAWAEADESFHARLVDLCGNRRLAKVAHLLFAQSHRVRLFTLHLRDKPSSSVKHHAALVDAIRKGRPDLARQIHAGQRDNWTATIAQLLERLSIHQL